MSARLPVLPLEPALDDARAPAVPLSALDTVWFQLAGTLCNIACRHCFITCGPKETRVPMIDAARVRAVLDEAEALGARDYYFTGGEPMMHPEFWPLVDDVLARGPLTVLTNGLLIDADAAARARRAFHRSRYSFDLRVSLDGMSADENNPVRGKGTFDAIVGGIRALGQVGLSPAITVVEHRAGMAAVAARACLPRVRALPRRAARARQVPAASAHRTRGAPHARLLRRRARPLSPTWRSRPRCSRRWSARRRAW